MSTIFLSVDIFYICCSKFDLHVTSIHPNSNLQIVKKTFLVTYFALVLQKMSSMLTIYSEHLIHNWANFINKWKKNICLANWPNFQFCFLLGKEDIIFTKNEQEKKILVSKYATVKYSLYLKLLNYNIFRSST